MKPTRVLLIAGLVAAIGAGCKGQPQGKVGTTLLAQGDDIEPVPKDEGAVTVEFPKDPLTELPKAEVVHLAIARETPYNQAAAVIERLENAGKTVRLLAASRKYVGVYRLNDELQGQAIRLWARRRPASKKPNASSAAATRATSIAPSPGSWFAKPWPDISSPT